MTCTALAARPQSRIERAAFPLHASLAVSFLAGSSLPTPLYPLYQAAWHFSPITVTVVFGIYAFAVLAALLVAGRLADHVGRRPVLVAATLAQVLAMAIFARAGGVGSLIAARILQGVATGAAMGAIGAALLDLHRERGTIANAVAPIMGTALGALAGGLAVHFLPAPRQSAYVLLGAVLALQGAALAALPESVARRPGALGSLRPHFRLPAAARAAFPSAAPVLVAVWAIAGLMGSLGPSLVRRVFHLDASLYGGLALFALAGSGALAVLALRRLSTDALLRLGTVGIGVGAALLAAGTWTAALALYVPGILVTGAGFGIGFQGALRSIVAPVAPQERAAVLSVVYVLCYMSMGLPAILAGCAVVGGCDLVATALAFAGGVMLLAVVSLTNRRRAR